VAEAPDIRDRFERRLGAAGYARVPPAPLLTDDPTVLFVGASITPFKPRILAGEPIDPCLSVQPCFRYRVHPDWLLGFEMLGVLAMASELDRVTADVVEFLTEERIVDAVRLHAVAHPDDADLRAAWVDAHPLGAAALGSTEEPGCVRWEYGHGADLTGRGLTMAWEAGPAARGLPVPGTRSARQLGNVIVLESAPSGQAYVEAAFSVEVLDSIAVEGDIYATARYAPLVAAFGEAGLSDASARAAANLARGIATLLASGCRPGANGAPYVVRSLTRRLAELAADGPAEDAVVAVVRSQLPSDARSPFDAELDRYRATLVRGMPRARAFLRRRLRSGFDGDLAGAVRETYGLPPRLVAELLETEGYSSAVGTTTERGE
jgi:alanyl-tRNA synthetase